MKLLNSSEITTHRSFYLQIRVRLYGDNQKQIFQIDKKEQIK